MKKICIEEWCSEISSSSKSLDDRSPSIDNERLRRIDKRSTPRRSSTPLFSITLSNEWPIDANGKNWTNVRRVDWLERIHQMSMDKVSSSSRCSPLNPSVRNRSFGEVKIIVAMICSLFFEQKSTNERTIVLISESIRRKAFDSVTDDDQLFIFPNIGKETNVSLSLSMIVFTLSMLRRDLQQKELVTKKTARRVKWHEKGGAKILFDFICPNCCYSVWSQLERFSIRFVPVECLLLPNWFSPIGDWFVVIDVRVTHSAVLLRNWESFIRSIHFPRQSVEKRERDTLGLINHWWDRSEMGT